MAPIINLSPPASLSQMQCLLPEELLPIMAYKKYLNFLRFLVSERVRISLLGVYERVGTSVFLVCKRSCVLGL